MVMESDRTDWDALMQRGNERTEIPIVKKASLVGNEIDISFI